MAAADKSPKKLKVMHLITKLELGGAQQNTLYCVGHHDRHLFDVSLACGKGGILDPEAAKIPRAKIFFLDCLRHPIHLFYDLVALFKLRALFKREKVDILHTHSSKAGILGRIAGRMAGVPVIIHTFHGFGFHDEQSFLVRKFFVTLERWTAKYSQALIAVSTQNVKKGLANKIGQPRQYTVIHSGIPLREFVKARSGKLRREIRISPTTPLVGMVACLKPQKAPVDFVLAAAEVHRQRPEVQFILAGDGELRPEVQKAVRDQGLGKVIRLLGWRRDVPEIMADLDILTLSSLWEGLPRVFPQAMACAKPIVATAVDGALEAIQNGRQGYLVPPHEPKALAKRIVDLVTNPGLAKRMGLSGRTKALQEFDIQKMVKDIEKVYLKAWKQVRGR